MQGTKARWIMPAAAPASYEAPLKHVSPTVVQILFNRGIADDEIASFLRPDTARMHAPQLMRGMSEAVRRIRAAIASGERIAVYGDFDVDGITGTVLLHQVLTTLGADCEVYVPHRRSEGYGLNTGALDRLRAGGVRLVVTVDCGISCADEVEHARGIGLDVIITDHHLPPERLPAAAAILNPNQPLCAYPFKRLAGVGVAFKLASALLEGVPDGHQVRREVLDLVVVGTVADMVPLVDENRILARYGLSTLSHTSRPGLRALITRAGLGHTSITTADIGYRLAPRLNAAGRIDHAEVGCRLLMTRDAMQAEDLAEELEAKNAERQGLTARALEEAKRRLGPSPPGRAILVDDASWSAGVIGLVAGRLAEEYCRPVFVVERADGESKGSARSIPGFNVVEALAECRDLLTKYGGHALAAGFSLHPDNIVPLRLRLEELAARRLRDEDLVPSIQLDAEIGGRDFGAAELRALHEQLAVLEPFGIGNQPPVLMWRNLRVAECKRVGEDHLRFSLTTPRGNVNAIAFGRAGDLGVLPRGTHIDAVFSLQYNEWNGYSSVELRIKDIAMKGDVARGIDRAPQVSPV